MKTDSGRTECVAWHPDGEVLALGGMRGEVQLFDASTGEMKSETKLDVNMSSDMWSMAWNPRGDILAITVRTNGVYLWDGGETKPIKVDLSDIDATVRRNQYRDVCWSHKGDLLAICNQNDVAILTPDGKIVAKAKMSAVRSIAWSPDDQSLVTGSAVNRISILDRQLNQQSTLAGHFRDGRPTHQWSSDGKSLAFNHRNETVQILGEHGIQKIVIPFAEEDGFERPIAWHPQRSELAIGCENYARIYNPGGQQVRNRKMKREHFRIRGLDWNNNGDELALGMNHNRIGFWSLASDKVSDQTIDEEDNIDLTKFDLSPDGKSIATHGGTFDRSGNRSLSLTTGDLLKWSPRWQASA